MEKHHSSWPKGKKTILGFVVVGILSLVWLIYKTGTKPSRIEYPCQKAAAATSMTFLAWIGAILGGHFLFKRLKPQFTIVRVMVVLAMVSFVTLGIKEYQVFQVNQIKAQQAGQPMGTPKGVNPGRVVWVHDNTATTGNYTNYWTQVNQATVDTMLDTAIKTLANQPNVGAALTRIFPCGASCTGRKVAIKVNMNNVFMGNASSMDANYQTVKAFLKEITTAVPGVFTPFNQTDIYVYDASRDIAGGNRTYFANAIKADFPNVHVVGSVGSNGAERAVFSSEAFIYDANYCSPTQAQNLRVPQLIKDVDYLVNMPLLKGHGMSGGSTLGFKNLVGNVESVTAYTSPWETAGLHNCLVIANNPTGLVAVYTAGFTNPDRSSSSIDRKMILTIGDGLYGDQFSNTNPPRNWRMFGNDAPNSLFVSQDPVAVDSVMFDTIMQETRNYQTIGQQHLEAAAQRSAGSLGVHEHPNQTGKCSSADNLNCWQFSGTAANGIDFVNCDAQGTPDSRCVLGVSTSVGATFFLQSSKASYTTAEEIPVQVLMNSETDAANVFSAQINFPTQNLEVVRIDTVGSFVSIWTDNFFDNAAGTISLIGSVPNPGYKTSPGQNAVMATVVFRPKLAGSATVSFGPSSQILRNSDNTNILTTTNNISLAVNDVPTPIPTPVPCTFTANSALWNTTTIPEASSVNLTVTGSSSCTGQTVNFNIKKNNLLADEDITSLTATFSASLSATTSWTTPAWFDDCGGIDPRVCNPSYHFDAVSGSNSQKSNDLTITQATTIPTSPTDWPQVQKDPQRTGYTQESIGSNIVRTWTYPFQPDRVHPQTQAIVYQGKVFVGTYGANGQKPTLYAIDAVNAETGTNPPRGRVIWRFEAGGPILNSVAAYDNKIFFGAMDGAVYAVDSSNGQQVWKNQLSNFNGFSTAPVIAESKIMLGGRDGNFYALDPSSGSVLWRYNAGSAILQTAAYDQGKAFFGTKDMYVHGVNTADGSQAWKSQRIPGLGFKDYWPVVTQGKVFVIPMAERITAGLRPGFPFSWFSAASRLSWLSQWSDTIATGAASLVPDIMNSQDAIINNYQTNPGNYTKNLFILDANTGQEVVTVPHTTYQTMNGATAPPCVDREGKLVVPIMFMNSRWGRLDLDRGRITDILYDGLNSAGQSILTSTNQTPVGGGNNDENLSVSCTANAVLSFHFMEGNANYTGSFNLDTRRWIPIAAGFRNRQMETNTQGGGINPASVSNGMIYHISVHELIARTTN